MQLEAGCTGADKAKVYDAETGLEIKYVTSVDTETNYISRWETDAQGLIASPPQHKVEKRRVRVEFNPPLTAREKQVLGIS